MVKGSDLRFLLSVFLSCLLVHFVSPLAYSSNLGGTFVFKKIAVLDLIDLTEKGNGDKIGSIVRSELDQMLRFDIIPLEPGQVRYPLSTKNLAKISERLQLDAYIAGEISVSNRTVIVSLKILDHEGKVFALELLSMKERAFEVDLDKRVRDLVVKLIHRIPYNAIITQVENGIVSFDAGRIQGVKEGTKASLFEIVGVERNPFTEEIISFAKKNLGEILVTKVDPLSATGKVGNVKKGVKILVHEKVDFIPSQEVIEESLVEKKELLAKKKQMLESQRAEKPPLAEKTPRRPRGSLLIGSGFILNDLRFSSDQLNFRRPTSPVPMVKVTGEYWFFSPLGLDASYATSRMRFDQTAISPQTDASPYWLAGHLKYRYFFSQGPFSPEITASVGYRIYNFQVDKSDLQYFNNIRYRGIDIAITAGYPLTSRIKAVLDLAYQPDLVVRENPVTSGTNSGSYAYSVGVTGYFNIYDGLLLALGYQYQEYQAKFSGLGTRNPPAGTTNASIHDLYHMTQLSLVYEF